MQNRRNGNMHLTVNETQQRSQFQGKIKSMTQIQQQNYVQRTTINQNIDFKDNTKEIEIIELLIDVNGQKMIAKLSLLLNNEFFIVINDSFEKFVIDQRKKMASKQLLNFIDMLKNRFESISNMLLENFTKKEVLYETYLASYYVINMRNSLKETLQSGKLDIQQKNFKLIDMLQKVKDLVERESKRNVQILIDEDIPNECKKIYNDYYHLFRTITNIVENSYKNTESGFVKILVHQSRIFKDNIRFDIIDSGKGIDPQLVKLINEDNFYNDNEEDEVINKLFTLFTLMQNKNMQTGDKTYQSNDNDDERNFTNEENVIKGFGLKFSHDMVKVIGPYNRIYVESVPGIGSRISFIVYKEGIPSQEGYFKPYQFKNDNFEQEIAYFNPLNSNSQNNQNYSLQDYIQNVISKLEPHPFISTSLVNINKPCQTRAFQSPFSKKVQSDDSNKSIYRSTSIKQQKKHKVSFSKVFSSKNIIDQQRSQFGNINQLSPLIQAISPNHYKYLNQNSIALSQSPPTYTQKSYTQEVGSDHIQNYFRNFQPDQSQMGSEFDKINNQNGSNYNQNSSRNHAESFSSPKYTSQISQYFPNIVLNFPSILKNTPTQISNNITVIQDSNQNSFPNLNGNPIGNNSPLSLQTINTTYINQNSNIHQPLSSNKYHSSGINYNINHTINSHIQNKNMKQLNNQTNQEKLVFDFNPDQCSYPQFPNQEQNSGQQDQTGVQMKNFQKTH